MRRSSDAYIHFHTLRASARKHSAGEGKPDAHVVCIRARTQGRTRTGGTCTNPGCTHRSFASVASLIPSHPAPSHDRMLLLLYIHRRRVARSPAPQLLCTRRRTTRSIRHTHRAARCFHVQCARARRARSGACTRVVCRVYACDATRHRKLNASAVLMMMMPIMMAKIRG